MMQRRLPTGYLDRKNPKGAVVYSVQQIAVGLAACSIADRTRVTISFE
jgi:hypothetical protein